MRIIFGLILAIFIVLLNFRIIIFDSDFYMRGNFKEINSSEYIDNLISYFKYENELNDSFNAKEKFHLEDVRSLIYKFNFIFYILSLVIVLLSIKYFKELPYIFIYSFIFLLFICLIIYFIDFSELFYKFHLVAFNNYLWLLDPQNDKLVVIFTEEFFYNALFIILKRSILFSFILFIIGFLKIVWDKYIKLT